MPARFTSAQAGDAVRISSSDRPFRAGAARPRASAGGARKLEQFVDIKISARSARAALGELEEAVVRIRDALSAAERLHDSGRLALSRSGFANMFVILGRAVEGLPYARRALEAATILNERRPIIRAQMVLGCTYLDMRFWLTLAEAELEELE